MSNHQEAGPPEEETGDTPENEINKGIVYRTILKAAFRWVDFQESRRRRLEAKALSRNKEAVSPTYKSKPEYVKCFIAEAGKHTYRKIRNFFASLYNNAEMVGILLLASMGLSTLLSGVAIPRGVPTWIEAAVIIPLVSVIIISLLIKLSEFRKEHHQFALI